MSNCFISTEASLPDHVISTANEAILEAEDDSDSDMEDPVELGFMPHESIKLPRVRRIDGTLTDIDSDEEEPARNNNKYLARSIAQKRQMSLTFFAYRHHQNIKEFEQQQVQIIGENDRARIDDRWQRSHMSLDAISRIICNHAHRF
jgi:hypothetical protein